MPTPRAFIVGETVHLHTRISVTGTKAPVDPATVRLTSLRRNGAETLAEPLDFTRIRTGEWAMVLDTATLLPGTYDLTVVHADGPERVSVETDTFVLQTT